MITVNKSNGKLYLTPASPLSYNLKPGAWYPVLVESLDYFIAMKFAALWQSWGWSVMVSHQLYGWMVFIQKGDD